jgi:PAS domain S-box-containing protein
MTRILILDREPVIRELLAEALDGPGRALFTAESSAEGIALIEKSGVDVALIDTQLASGEWTDVVNALRQVNRDAEVILMSAAPSFNALFRAVELGACEFLPKPFDEISQVVMRVAAAEQRVTLRRESQRLEEALRASEARYRNLFEASPDAIVVYDEVTCNVRDANPAVERVYGISPEELLGRNFSEFWGELPAPASVALSQVDPRQFRSVNRRDRREDGTPVDVEVSRGNFTHADIPMVVDVIRDVTKKLRDEDERRALEAQLRQAQKTEALGLLAGGIAHDFNNLLSVMLNYANFAKEALESDSPDRSKSALADLDQVLQATRSAALVTRQLLTFSRREVVSPELLDISEVVDNIAQLIRSSLGSKCVLVLDLSRDLPRAQLDRGQLEQIILNLALNARDAMTDGGTLTIRTQNGRDTDDNPQVSISVADTGTGIPPGVLPLIFDPFFTTKERGKGTGLGLATVRGIVDRAGGEVLVETAPNAGTTFELRIPASNERTSIRSVTSSDVPPCGGTETLLLVDDDGPVRRAARRILARAGYHVVEACNAEEALAKFRLYPGIALLVTDLMMPGKTGEELAKELRDSAPHLPVVYVSGFTTQSVIDEIDELKLAAVLGKPYHAHSLLGVVRELLDGRVASCSRRTGADARSLTADTVDGNARAG